MPFPVTEHWIQEAERTLGRRLPSAYRDRLMRDNGGEIAAAGETWYLYPIWDKSDRKRTARTSNHLLAETRSAATWVGFPPDAVAIASNGSGDRLVLLPDETDSDCFQNHVYLWDHETRQLEPTADFVELAG